MTTVGVELELFPVRDGAVVAVAETAAALDGLPWVAFEPGGQVELNPPPAASAAGALACLSRLRDAAARRLASIGVELVAVGLWAEELPLQLTTERYRGLDAHYATIGPAGRVFMRQTASTQIGVGRLPGESQWQAANLVAPLLAATFGNSSPRGGRQAVLAAADPARHRLRWVGAPMADAYDRFAAGAAPIGRADHRSTLFPPVRPRDGYLEVRAVDSLGGAELGWAVRLTAALLSTPAAVQRVLSRLEVSDEADDRRWALAAGDGIADAAMRAEVLALLDVAGVPASCPLWRRVARGRGVTPLLPC